MTTAMTVQTILARLNLTIVAVLPDRILRERLGVTWLDPSGERCHDRRLKPRSLRRLPSLAPSMEGAPGGDALRQDAVREPYSILKAAEYSHLSETQSAPCVAYPAPHCARERRVIPLSVADNSPHLTSRFFPN